MTAIDTVVLCILDGWGQSETPAAADDAIAAANTPSIDRLACEADCAFLDAAGEPVGLPHGQQGNSEVGHMTIGTGRLIPSELNRISTALSPDFIAAEPVIASLSDRLCQLRATGVTRLHLFGLFSKGGVHAHIDHATALASYFASQGIEILLHVVTDGRDTPPRAALAEMAETIVPLVEAYPNIHVATICGRYYAMDRDKNYDRQHNAMRAITEPVINLREQNTGDALDQGGIDHFATLSEAIQASYANNLSDEFIPPARIGEYGTEQMPALGQAKRQGRGHDAFLCVNFRADRARQIMTLLFDPDPSDLPDMLPPRFPTVRSNIADGHLPASHPLAYIGTMSSYSERLDSIAPPLFLAQRPTMGLGECLANAGHKQFRAAETEKYAHVTFFFNGGKEQPWEGEERCLVPTPKVATYDLLPEMAAAEVASKVIAAVQEQAYRLVVVNFANTDMVGHTGKFDAAVRAVEAVDDAIGRILRAIDAEVADGAGEKRSVGLLVTADHGNAEKMGTSDKPHTSHTANKVPFWLTVRSSEANDGVTPPRLAASEGSLADIAPTILRLLGIEQPHEMDGKSLV